MMTHLGKTLILLAAMALASACGGGDGSDTPPPNSPPVASFTLTPSSGTAPLTVQLDASASTDTGGAIARYSWDFGDSSAAGSGVAVSHVYGAAGTFTVTLTVADNQGAVGTATGQVTVSNPLVPNVVGLSEAAARAAITAAALTVGTVSPSSSSSVLAGNVISQSPVAGVPVSPGTAVSLIVSTGPSGGGSLIQISLLNPTPGAFVPDQTAIEAQVASTYEIGSVTADMAGREIALAVDTSTCASGGVCSFVGTLSLGGLAIGPYPLTIRAADTAGNTEQLTVTVVHDNPPVLTVIAPLNDSVALPTLPVDIRCTDDLPGCVVEVRVQLVDQWVAYRHVLIGRAPGGLLGPVDLSRWIGETIPLVLRAQDSAGQQTNVQRQVFVESPARLTVLTEVPGKIVDADDTRLLFVETTTAGDRIAIYTRATALTESISMPDGRTVNAGDAYLTPSGAIFVTHAGKVTTSRLYLWRSGALTDLAYPDSAHSIAVSGDYAIWSEGTILRRLNMVTGAQELVSSNANNWGNSVVDDGTVVFGTLDTHQIVRDRSGTQTALTSDTTQLHSFPVTDGSGVVCARQDPCCTDPQYDIVLIADGSSIALTPERDLWLTPTRDYSITNGWVAYTDVGALQQLHVFTRSPEGVITRHTDLSTSSVIDWLAGNGEVMVINGNQRFFSRGNGMVPVSSYYGESYWLNGAWHVAIGRALLAVDTRD